MCLYLHDADRAYGFNALKTYCVVAPSKGVPVDPQYYGGSAEGVSFGTPIVASALANARLLWPSMTSRQTVRLAQYCARPINSDGTLQPWGTILTETTASDVWGQGVFSVECLFESNGALRNPITNQRLAGRLAVRGATSTLSLTDQFGRDYQLVDNKKGFPLINLPDVSGFFATPERILGYQWSEHFIFAVRHEENEFFGSYGIGDFELGDSWTGIIQLGYRWDLTAHSYIGLSAQSSYGVMRAARRSVVRDARGHAHQLKAGLGYRRGALKADFALSYHTGLMGRMAIADHGNLSLAPQASALAEVNFAARF